MSFVVYKNVFCSLQQSLLLSTAMYFVLYSNVFCSLQQCVPSSTVMSLVVYSNVFVLYSNVFCHLQQCLLLSTAMSFVHYSNVFLHLQQYLWLSTAMSLSFTAMSFVLYSNVFCPLQQCLLSSTAMTFVHYSNVFRHLQQCLCPLQQCLLSFITRSANASLLNSPWIFDCAEKHKVLSSELCCLDWLHSYGRFGETWCLSRAERGGSMLPDIGTYRRHYRYPPLEDIIIPIHFCNNSKLKLWVKVIQSCLRIISCHGCGDQLLMCHLGSRVVRRQMYVWAI